MFGYVRIFKEDLTFREYEDYRGVYCSLCRLIGKRYGHLPRMMLSYDMTFAAILSLSLSDTPVTFCKARCPYNPLARRTCCRDDARLESVAAMSVILCHGAWQDKATDSRGLAKLWARTVLFLFRKAYRKAAAFAPDFAQTVTACLCDQAAFEQAPDGSADAAADPTARMTEALFAALAEDETDKRVLSRLGYCLGRWIYLMDAADDLESDRKSGNFNPFLNGEQDDLAAIRLRAEHSLCASLNESLAAYDLLSVRRFDSILRHILEKGCLSRQWLVLHPEGKDREQRERSV